MLEVREIDVSHGDLLAVEHASLSVAPKSVVSLVGSNGAGKTTLIRTISGLHKISHGAIFFDGERIDNLPPHSIVERGIVQVPEGRLLFPEMTVLENLEMGAYTKRARNQAAETLPEVLSLFPILESRKHQLAKTLSGGEQQMVAIGRGLMTKPKLLMLDEPSLGLAPIVVQEIFKVIRTISNFGTSILLVEQNVFLALSVSDVAFVVENGKIVMQGKGEEILNDDRIKEAYLGL